LNVVFCLTNHQPRDKKKLLGKVSFVKKAFTFKARAEYLWREWW